MGLYKLEFLVYFNYTFGHNSREKNSQSVSVLPKNLKTKKKKKGSLKLYLSLIASNSTPYSVPYSLSSLKVYSVQPLPTASCCSLSKMPTKIHPSHFFCHLTNLRFLCLTWSHGPASQDGRLEAWCHFILTAPLADRIPSSLCVNHSITSYRPLNKNIT